MSDSALKPWLALPVELLSFVVPDPFSISGVQVPINHNFEQRWLAIKQTWPSAQVETQRTVAALRALSQTSRAFRALALPRLWTICQVSSVDELGRVREALRASPALAQHIRSFSFAWEMPELTTHNDGELARQAGITPLEWTFSDRFAIWNDLRQRHACEVQWHEFHQTWYFKLNDEPYYFAPGKYPKEAVEQRDVNSHLRVGGNGPDDKGEDRRIKNPQQFTECVNEIITQLSSLEAFAWNCSIPQLPHASLCALKVLPNLTSLGYGDMFPWMDHAHALPLWELAHNLEDLSLLVFQEQIVDEQEEAECASFEVPVPLPADMEFCDIENLHALIATRTIITAARGGRLRRLYAGGDVTGSVDHAFAIPALLPYWVALDTWYEPTGSADGWANAALALRRLLAHASRWSDGRRGWRSPRQDRKLTCLENQSLGAQYGRRDLSKMSPRLKFRPDTTQLDASPHPADVYLAWLAQDAQLAQQVADVWNGIVEQGQADQQKCRCARCAAERKVAKEIKQG